MAYGLKYIVPFKTISEIPCEVKIEVTGYAGQVIELAGGGTPFVINVDESDFTTPIRSSSATLSVFGSDYLQDLYASDPQGIKVTLFAEGSIRWIGFVTPDTFSQNFTDPEFIYEIECVAALSTLRYKKFDLTDDFVTFRQIVTKAKEYAGYSDVIHTNAVYAPSCSYFDLGIASANFYDELGEAMTYYEALEEIAKFAGCCFEPDNDILYFIDYAAIASGYNSYSKFSGGVVNLQDARIVKNYKGTGTKISRIAGKNKATVNCSLYEIKNIIPPFDDTGSSVFFAAPVSSHDHKVQIKGNDNDITYRWMIRRYFQPNFTFYSYYNGDPNDRTESSAPPYFNNTGSGLVRTTEFDVAKPPSRLSMDTELQVKVCNNTAGYQAGKVLNSNSPILTMKSGKSIMTHKDLWFCISLQYKRSDNEYPREDMGFKITSATRTDNVKAKFRIGNMYYNGTGWTTTESTFNMPATFKKGEDVYAGYKSLDNKNTYETGLGDMDGYIFKAPDAPTIGECELTLYQSLLVIYDTVNVQKYLYFKGIELSYAIPDESSIYGDYVDKGSKNDVIYENEIQGGYVEAADDIDLKICTNTDGKLTLSSVLEGNKFLGVLKSDVYGTDVAERLLLKRVIDLFETPRFIIDPTLASGAKPYAKFTEPHLGKQFLVAGGEEDVKMESTRYNLIEL